MKWLRVTLLFVLFLFMLLLLGHFAVAGSSAVRESEGRSAFDSFFLCLLTGLLALIFLLKIKKEFRGDGEKPTVYRD